MLPIEPLTLIHKKIVFSMGVSSWGGGRMIAVEFARKTQDKKNFIAKYEIHEILFAAWKTITSKFYTALKRTNTSCIFMNRAFYR